MKKMRKIRSLLAMVTALALILSGGMVSAEDAEEVKVENIDQISYGDLKNDLKVIVNGEWPHNDNISEVTVNGQLDGNLTVESSKTVVEEYVRVNKDITGDVTMTADQGNAYVLTNYDIKGNVTMTANQGIANILSGGDIKGNVTMTANHGIANISPGEDIKGNVTMNAENGGNATLVSMYEEGSAINIYDVEGTATLTAAGGGEVILETGDVKEITVSSTGDDKITNPKEQSTVTVIAQDTGAVVSNVYNGGTADITVEDVTVSAEGGNITGISVNQDGGTAGTTEVKADSVKVTLTGAYGNTAYGVEVTDGTVVIGDKESEGNVIDAEASGDSNYAYGVFAKGSSEVTVNGGIAAKSEESAGLYAADNADVTVTTGSVSVEASSSGSGIVIRADQKNEKASVNVEDGSVESKGTGNMNGLTVYTQNKGEAVARVAGDVTADGRGVQIQTYEGGKIDVLIEGTLSGSRAVGFVNYEAAENTTLTVWQAESTKYQDLVGAGTSNFTAAINYIVKLADGLTKSDVSTANHNTVTYNAENREVVYGQDTADMAYDYHTANEDEDVIVSAQLQEGEVLDGVYYNAGDKDENGKINEGSNLLTFENNGLTKQEDGSVLLKMLRGGGMLLGLKTHHTHKMTSYAAVPATCTAGGNSAYWYCSLCNKYFSDANGATEISANSWLIPATGHAMTATEAVPATCTEAGNSAYWYCDQCKNYFSDADGKNEIAKDSWVIKAKGHTEVTDKAVAATCTETGLTEGKHCSVCEAVLVKQEVVPAKGHTPAAAVKENEKEAQAGIAGSYDEVVYCAACKAEISRETVTTDPLPEPEPEEEPEPPAVITILKIIDKTGTTAITFLSNGTYQAAYADGTSERGRFSLKDGGIVLVNDGDTATEMAVTLNPDTGRYDLTFRASGDPEKTFEFEIEEKDVRILIRNRS